VARRALIQMTLNISFLFWLSKQTSDQAPAPASSRTIVYHNVNMTVKFIFVWSSGKPESVGEKEMNEMNEMKRKKEHEVVQV
jgi:hypothetical protein